MRAWLALLGWGLAACLSGCAGPSAADRAEQLTGLVYKLDEQGHLREALVIAQEAVRQLRSDPETPPLVLAEAMLGVGLLEGQLAKNERSLATVRSALQVLEAAGAGDSSTAGEAWRAIGMAHYDLGALDEAEACLVRAEDIHRRLGQDKASYAAILTSLAYVLSERARFEESLELNQRALAIFEEVEGPDDITTAAVLNNLAQLHFELGEYARARPLLERALRITSKVQGLRHPNTAICLHNLADLIAAQGDLVKAKAVYEQAQAALETSLGRDHPTVAYVLNNLGLVFYRLGDLERSQQLHERALAIREQALGPDHFELGITTHNLASTLMTQGNWKRAQPLFERSLRIHAIAFGPVHPRVAGSRISLARTLMAQGRFGEAERQMRSGLAVTRKVMGPQHKAVGHILVLLGEAVTRRGSLERGQAFLEKGLAIVRKAVGDEHDVTAQGMESLAWNAWAQGEPAQARELMAKAIAIRERITGTLLSAMSARARIALLNSRRRSLDLVFSLFDRPQDAARTYELVFRWKGAATSSLVAQRLASLAVDDDALRKDIQDLRKVRQELVGRLFMSGRKDEAPAGQENLAYLRRRKEDLERSLAERSRAFALVREERQADWRKVCLELGPDRALVDFFRYRPRTAKQEASALSRQRLAAFVLHSGSCESPIRVELGDYQSIQASIAHLRKLLAASASRPRVGRQARRLYAKLWDALEPALKGRRWVWLATSGVLSNLPFEVLMDERGGLLADGYTFSYLSAGRDLARQSLPTNPTRDALVVGDVDYGQGERAPAAHPLSGLVPVQTLPATRLEAAAVSLSLLTWVGEVLQIGGGEASEGRFKTEAPGRRLIHLATHGFFATGKLGDGIFGDKASSVLNFNPMVLSGILLAGVNRVGEAWAAEDGLLTAAEVAGLDLRGCELVVLSACESGLGKVEYGGGVMGLRRGFILAGARSVIMSLWKVPDEETRLLMEAFYNRLAADPDGDKAVALREAKVELREHLTAERGWADPRAWAAFVISGR